MNRRLYRSVSDRKIGGVAAGTATYFDIDPSISRVLWLLLAIFTGGAFLIVYLVMWAVLPEEPWNPPVGVAAAQPGAAAPTPEAAEGEASDVAAGGGAAAEAETAGAAAQPPAQPTWSGSPSAEVRSGPGPHVIFGTILILIGGWFLLDQFIPWLSFGTIWPIGLVAIGAIILVAALRRGG